MEPTSTTHPENNNSESELSPYTEDYSEDHSDEENENSNFLESPIDCIGKITQNLKYFNFSFCEMQGYRSSQEDAYIFTRIKSIPEIYLFAILDGHGSDYISNYFSKKIPEKLNSLFENNLNSLLENRNNCNRDLSLNLSFDERLNLVSPQEVIELINDMDKEFVLGDKEKEYDDSGSTLIMGLLYLNTNTEETENNSKTKTKTKTENFPYTPINKANQSETAPENNSNNIAYSKYNKLNPETGTLPNTAPSYPLTNPPHQAPPQYPENKNRKDKKDRKDEKDEKSRNGHIFRIFNLGDSRAFLLSPSATVPLSSDHVPSSPSELSRINRTAFVSNSSSPPRISGILSVSRCLGDGLFKRHPKAPYNQQAVISLPDFKQISVPSYNNYNEGEGERVYFACDGLFEAFELEELGDILRSRGRGREEEVLRKSLEMGSTDNMSLICVSFKNNANLSSDKEEEGEAREFLAGRVFGNIDNKEWMEKYFGVGRRFGKKGLGEREMIWDGLKKDLEWVKEVGKEIEGKIAEYSDE